MSATQPLGIDAAICIYYLRLGQVPNSCELDVKQMTPGQELPNSAIGFLILELAFLQWDKIGANSMLFT